LTRFERRHDNLSQQDDSGYSALAGFGWDPSGRVRMEINATRGLAPYYDALGSYRLDNSFSITPTWQATGKLTARLQLQETRTDFHAPLPPSGIARADALRRIEIGADWAAARSASLGARLERQQRSSNDPAFRYRATITSFNLSLSF
jgi:hypothetical protein